MFISIYLYIYLSAYIHLFIWICLWILAGSAVAVLTLGAPDCICLCEKYPIGDRLKIYTDDRRHSD